MNVRKVTIILSIIVALFSIPFEVFSENAPSPRYTFGVVPQFETSKLIAIWQPILDEVEKRSGIHLEFKTTKTIFEINEWIENSRFDFVYINPYIYWKNRDNYLPLLRDVDHKLSGVLVVRKDSHITDVSMVDGLEAAFPAPKALGATVMTNYDIKEKYDVTVNHNYVHSHDSVYLNVAMGLFDVGGGVQKTLMRQPDNIKDRLRVLYETEGVAAHPIIVHKRVPEDITARVMGAFMALAETEKGQAMLAKVPVKRLGHAVEKDYLFLDKYSD